MAKQNTTTSNMGTDAAPSRFVTVATDRPQYKPAITGADGVETRNKFPLVGWLLSKIVGLPNPTAKPGEKNQTWNAYVIKTTEPTYAEGLDDNGPREYPAGTEVMIGESAKLSRLEELLFADKIVEVSIIPKKKVQLDGGRTMWTFDVGANPKPQPRPATTQAFTGHAPPRQLAAANGAGHVVEGTLEERIPF